MFFRRKGMKNRIPPHRRQTTDCAGAVGKIKTANDTGDTFAGNSDPAPPLDGCQLPCGGRCRMVVPMSDKSQFQHLAKEVPVLIWMSGLDMGCYYFNRAWLEFRGRTLEQERGNGWVEGVHPEDVERCVSHYVTCFERHV